MSQSNELQQRVNQLEQLLADTRQGLEPQRQTRARIAKALVAVLAVGSLVAGVQEARAWGGCNQFLSSYGLTTFCAGDPALATDINGNFQVLAKDLEAKVGTVTDPNVTVKSNLAVTGTTTVTGKLTANGGLTVVGAETISSTLGVTGATTVGDLTVNGKLNGQTLRLFGGMYSTVTVVGPFPGPYCGTGSSWNSVAQTNPLTSAASCPAGYTTTEVFTAQVCRTNFGSYDHKIYYCWK